jgi:hypothetical protein
MSGIYTRTRWFFFYMGFAGFVAQRKVSDCVLVMAGGGCGQLAADCIK